MADCRCYRCTQKAVRANPAADHELVLGNDPRMVRMFLCATCGNKRCPHAADHRLTCSGSNEPGQAGSLYESAPRPPAESDADSPNEVSASTPATDAPLPPNSQDRG